MSGGVHECVKEWSSGLNGGVHKQMYERMIKCNKWNHLLPIHCKF